MDATTSTGLSPRVASLLAYGGWWMTGFVVWLAERRDPSVRFHAAQSFVAFGLVALFVLGFGFLALASLSFIPVLFTPLVWAALLTWGAGIALWGVAIWKTASGEMWRVPFVADLADRMAAL